MVGVAKVTISLPSEALEAVEREREAKGETRSAFFLYLIEDYLRREQERHDDEAYVRGYQEFPESEDEELKAWVQASQGALANLYRDEEPYPEDELKALGRQ